MKNINLVYIKPFVKFFLFYIALIILTCTNKSNAQSILTFDKIPTIIHTDSLEKSIISKKEVSKNYINQLIILEQSRYNVMSAKFGIYANTIDSLSEIVQYPFGLACGSYFKSIRNILMSPIYAGSTIQSAEKALHIFEELDDEVGIFYSKLSLIIIYIYNIKNEGLSVYSSSNQLFASNLNKRCIKIKHQYMFENYMFALKSSNPKYLIKSINPIVIDYVFAKDQIIKSRADIIKLRKLIASTIKMTHDSNELQFQSSSQYNLMSYIEENEQALIYLKNAFQEKFHPESSFKSLIARNIANRYYFMKRKFYRDSTIHYLKVEFNIAKKFDTIKKIFNYDSYNLLANLHEEKSNFSAAYQSKIEAYDNLVELNKHYNNIVTDSYQDFEKLKNEKNEKNEINSQKNKLILYLLFGLSLLIILIIFMIILIKKNKSIKSSKDKVDQLIKTRDKLYAILTHDIQNPLRSFQGLASKVSYLIHKKDFNEIDKVAFEIDESGTKLDNMLQNILYWILAQQNELIYFPKAIKINDLVIQLVDVYEGVAKQKNISFIKELNFHGELAIDENHLHIILRNLLDNAIKNSPRNSAIQINLLESDEFVEFYLKNECEISAEKFSTILDLFHSKKEWQVGEQGVGLGLILIKEFTKKMGG